MLLDDRLEQAGQQVLHVVEHLVDDRIQADFDALALGFGAGAVVLGDVEAQDDRLGGGRQQDVVDRHVARAGADDFQIDLLALDAFEGAADGFQRAEHVGLENDVERALVAAGLLLEQFVEGQRRLGGLAAERLEAFGRGALFGHLAGFAVVLVDVEFAAGRRHAGQAEDLDGGGRAGGADLVALVVDHGLHAAPAGARDDGVVELEGAVGDQHVGRGAHAGFEARFDDVALRLAAGIGLELEDVGLQQDHLEQVVHAVALGGADGAADQVAAPVFGRGGPSAGAGASRGRDWPCAGRTC